MNGHAVYLRELAATLGGEAEGRLLGAAIALEEAKAIETANNERFRQEGIEAITRYDRACRQVNTAVDALQRLKALRCSEPAMKIASAALTEIIGDV